VSSQDDTLDSKQHRLPQLMWISNFDGVFLLAAELQHDTSFILDVVPEEDDATSSSSKACENGTHPAPSEPHQAP
jgi:hypothetical protein